MILIIDNYDSFTFNLFQAVSAVAVPRTAVEVVRRESLSLERVAQLAPSHVVVSPGPGHPANTGLSLDVFRALPATPILDVCLGHQAFAIAHGADVVRSAHPTHGSAALIEHDSSALFRGQPRRFHAALYHSLAVDRATLPAELVVSAWTDAGDIMALRHVNRPHVGVQFHPESFLTPTGAQLLRAFLDCR